MATILKNERMQVVVAAGWDPVSEWTITGWQVGGMNWNVIGKKVS